MEKYIVVSNANVVDLAAAVNARMKDGYMPIGGVSYGAAQFHQGMVHGQIL